MSGLWHRMDLVQILPLPFTSHVTLDKLLLWALTFSSIKWVDITYLLGIKWDSSSSVNCSIVSWLFATPWTVPYRAPLSIGFSRKEYWSGLPFPSPEDLSNPGIEPWSPALQADSLPSELQGNPQVLIRHMKKLELRWCMLIKLTVSPICSIYIFRIIMLYT